MPSVMLWAILILGAWVMLSPWLLGFSGITLMMWSNLLVGLALILIPLWLIFGGERPILEEENESGND